MSDPRFALFFRRARPARPAWNVAKTALQLVVFWTVFLLVVPSALVAVEREYSIPSFHFSKALAVAFFVLASLLGLTSGYTMAWHGAGTPLPFDSARQLVMRGPYRYVRNPMAIAGIAQGICVACYRGSWFSLVFAAAGSIVWNYMVRPIEEQELETKFGVAYAQYRESVRCWIPRYPGHTDVVHFK